MNIEQGTAMKKAFFLLGLSIIAFLSSQTSFANPNLALDNRSSNLSFAHSQQHSVPLRNKENFIYHPHEIATHPVYSKNRNSRIGNSTTAHQFINQSSFAGVDPSSHKFIVTTPSFTHKTSNNTVVAPTHKQVTINNKNINVVNKQPIIHTEPGPVVIAPNKHVVVHNGWSSSSHTIVSSHDSTVIVHTYGPYYHGYYPPYYHGYYYHDDDDINDFLAVALGVSLFANVAQAAEHSQSTTTTNTVYYPYYINSNTSSTYVPYNPESMSVYDPIPYAPSSASSTSGTTTNTSATTTASTDSQKTQNGTSNNQVPENINITINNQVPSVGSNGSNSN